MTICLTFAHCFRLVILVLLLLFLFERPEPHMLIRGLIFDIGASPPGVASLIPTINHLIVCPA